MFDNSSPRLPRRPQVRCYHVYTSGQFRVHCECWLLQELHIVRIRYPQHDIPDGIHTVRLYRGSGGELIWSSNSDISSALPAAADWKRV
jgi:hypothetical protein